jgi:hypothetical protein
VRQRFRAQRKVQYLVEGTHSFSPAVIVLGGVPVVSGHSARDDVGEGNC